ncbi:acyltransferase family protein [Saccharomonospora azurea]|uniref:acyltransferase family protein n=1 Tax=Saccharomonospora azurea TaxID=40988 RepID=UPI003D904CE3
MASTAHPDSISARGNLLPSLTGARFIAALVVFLVHAGMERLFQDEQVDTLFANAFTNTGWMAMAFFFLLSGFVLTWSTRPDDSANTIWRRRLLRIYPNHVVTFLIALALLWVVGEGPTFGQAVSNLFLVHTWVPDPSFYVSVNGVSWSLSADLLFYLMFPLWLFLANRIRPTLLWACVVAAVLAIVALAVAADLWIPAQPELPELGVSNLQFWAVYIFPASRALEFLIGILLARIVLTGQWRGPGLGTVLVMVGVAHVVAFNVPQVYSLVAVGVVPAALLVLALATADLRGAWTPLRNPTMVFLGELSFAFYLLHRMVQHYGHYVIGPESSYSTPVAVGLILAALLVTLGLSWLLYTFIEQPITRNWARRRHPALAASGPGSSERGSNPRSERTPRA